MATKKEKPGKPMPGLLITVKDGFQQVRAADAFWAGVSHVPAANFSAAQQQELKEHEQLQVEDAEIHIVDTSAAADNA